MPFSIIHLMFLSTLIFAIILSVSSPSWFGAWVGLELNMMSFIPLIASKLNPYLSEAALKYFLVQAFGSTIIIMSSSLFLLSTQLALLLLLALLLKLGMAPFHFWLPHVMEGLTWPTAIILASIQKIAPMIMISYTLIYPISLEIILFSAIASAIVGALGGLNLTLLRKIMAFSSINHMSWMLIALSINTNFWLLYFTFYALISSSVMLIFSSYQSYNIADLVKSNPNSLFHSLLYSIPLLSLGGLPPFTGFLPKWMLIQILFQHNMIMPLVFLIVSALVTLYFYLRIFTPSIMTFYPCLPMNSKYSFKNNYPPLFFVLILFNVVGLLFPILFHSI